jgi:hypothetical protein
MPSFSAHCGVSGSEPPPSTSARRGRSGCRTREVPFAEDTEHASYDSAAVTRYWQVLSQVNLVLEAFAARFSGKTSPVHHFWHTFDFALTLWVPEIRPPTVTCRFATHSGSA